MQGLVRGHLQRNRFYQDMKDTGFKPNHYILNRRFIGWKLSRISKKQVEHMKVERQAMYASIKEIDKNN